MFRAASGHHGLIAASNGEEKRKPYLRDTWKMDQTSITAASAIDTFLVLLIGIGPKLALVPFLTITASLNLDHSGAGRGWLLFALCRFSAVVSGSRVSGRWRSRPMCSGGHRLRPRRCGLLSGSQGRGGWSGRCGQGAQPVPAGQEGVLPGPGPAELEDALAGVAGQPGGQAQEPSC